MEKVLMHRAQIARYNDSLVRTLGARARLYDLAGFHRVLPRGEVAAWVGGETPQAWAEALENRALGALTDGEPRWGITVRRVEMRALPTARPLPREMGDRYDDSLQLTAILPHEPLALLHTSADGKFFFAAAENCMGWVAAEGVALCEFDDLRRAAGGDFLLVTGSEMALCADPYEPRVSRRRLTMGTRLALAAPRGTVRSVRGRQSYDNYIVSLPSRGADGKLEWVSALVPVSAPVHEGYLPYTAENVAAQAEKLRGEVYGWGGMLGARDCSALVGEVYRCFGFRLPRDSAALAMLPGAEEIAHLTAEEKRAKLCALPRGTLLYFPGHIMLSFGEEGGEPLCLSAAGNFLPPGSAGGERRAVNTVAVTPLRVVRANGKTWLDSLTKIIRIP